MGRCWTHVQGFEQELKLAFSRGTRRIAVKNSLRCSHGRRTEAEGCKHGRACAGPFSNFVSFWFPRFAGVTLSRYLYFDSFPSCGHGHDLFFFRVILHSGNDWHRVHVEQSRKCPFGQEYLTWRICHEMTCMTHVSNVQAGRNKFDRFVPYWNGWRAGQNDPESNSAAGT
jgi:hypothetical protein